MEQLQGKTVIVTGSSSGIGEGIAKGFAKEGANVVLAARREDKLSNLKAEIEKQGNGRVLAVQADISNQKDVENIVIQATEAFGQVDVLVNNAGQMLAGQVTSGEVEEWERMIGVNLKGLLYNINAILLTMLERSNGNIITTTYDYGLK